MKCQKCGSDRVLVCYAKASDCQNYTLAGKFKEGYAPTIDGICGGDDLCPDICLNCGQVQGEFPKPPVEGLEDGETD